MTQPSNAAAPRGFRNIGQHGIMAQANHDEAAREDFVAAMYYHVQSEVFPGNKIAYEERVLPRFLKEKKRPPETRQEIRREMEREPAFQWWSSLRRTTQEMKQATGEELVARQITDLLKKSKVGGKTKGSLRLDPSLAIPRYLSKVDFHCQPGGYFTERTEDDITPAAIYDPGVYVLTKGFMGPYCEAAGATAINYLGREFPGFRPRKILDMGCSVGHSTLPYCDAFPQAEVHAIDASAPMVRYAHARAESMGRTVHFSQQNAEFTDFPDKSFDLVLSHIVLHETSRTALTNIVKECKRLLRPGGMMLHLEQRQHYGMDAFEQFYYDWDTLNNNEPFWGTLHDMNLADVAVAAGFERGKVIETLQPNVVAADMLDTLIDEGQDFKRTALWFVFGARV
ncbi:MAG: class I SAM-dependent methyltransferase [Proteobacteria bacterium]|nr:class I SAM-dependent methyltransferase [Pseudomonadota bacterium]